MKRQMLEMIRLVEERRHEYLKSAQGCPIPVAEAMSKEKHYDALLNAANMLCEYIEDNEDDLK